MPKKPTVAKGQKGPCCRSMDRSVRKGGVILDMSALRFRDDKDGGDYGVSFVYCPWCGAKLEGRNA